jgi:hypothetical protein
MRSQEAEFEERVGISRAGAGRAFALHEAVVTSPAADWRRSRCLILKRSGLRLTWYWWGLWK